MFVGHYGPSLAGKALDKSIPLWVLFLAVQWLDVCWAVFVLLGVEKVRIAPGITKSNPLDLYYMPYTHGLVTAILWSLAAACVYRWVRKQGGWNAAAIVGAAVFSHRLLDLVVHRPDLPLWDDRWKVGLGLWNYPGAAFAIEMVVLFGGMYLYWHRTKPVRVWGRYGMPIFGAALALLQAAQYFGPQPQLDRSAVVIGLVLYGSFAAIAALLERGRA